jgi:hypothetical protein
VLGPPWYSVPSMPTSWLVIIDGTLCA